RTSHPESSMSHQPIKLARAIRIVTTTLPLGLTLLGLAPALAFAQTTSSIRGTVNGPDGSAAADTQVLIIDSRTGTTRSYATNAAGTFNARGLSVGGPYMITVDSS